MNRVWLALAMIVLIAGVSCYYYLYFEVAEPVRYSSDEVYLTRYASIVTSAGVYGFEPGTKLLLEPSRRGSPGMVCVTDGKHQLEVAPDALTRNPEVARHFADTDRTDQAQAVAGVVAAKAHVTKVETDAQLARAHDIDRLNAQQRRGVPTPIPTPVRTPTPTPPVR